MPTWLSIVIDVLKALVAGEFKSWWQEHKEKETNSVENKVNAMSDADVSKQLHDQWTKH